jgi:hypothetical protein
MYHLALKEWNKGNRNWINPRKGTPEYAEVIKLKKKMEAEWERKPKDSGYNVTFGNWDANTTKPAEHGGTLMSQVAKYMTPENVAMGKQMIGACMTPENIAMGKQAIGAYMTPENIAMGTQMVGAFLGLNQAKQVKSEPDHNSWSQNPACHPSQSDYQHHKSKYNQYLLQQQARKQQQAPPQITYPGTGSVTREVIAYRPNKKRKNNKQLTFY